MGILYEVTGWADKSCPSNLWPVPLHCLQPYPYGMKWVLQFHLLRNLFLLLSLKRPVLLGGEKEEKDRVCKVWCWVLLVV
ncbi:hypothetical protein VNO80_02424 [Phaseolus coccineus]|uniref:Uncharacterized protein n=1 Tax=Phaseolus coccineus TaxID=3886 RepID=A0AAN9NV20_PHACN